MRKIVIFVLIITIFTNCSKDEIEVDPALEYMPYQLTSFGMDYNPVLSPDTKHVVYQSIRYQYERFLQNMNSGQRLTDLWIMDRYGENDWRIFKREEMGEGFKIISVKWSPNSDYITVIISKDIDKPRTEFWLINLNGEKTKLNSLDFPIRDIEYSPDGKKVAYIAYTHDFYIANSDFTDKKLIDKNNRSVINSISWTMDSKSIFFSDNYLCKIQPDAINKPMLKDTLGSGSDVQCSKSENLLIYNANSNIYLSSTESFEPKLVKENAGLFQLVPKRNMIAALSFYRKDDTPRSYNFISDLSGNIIYNFKQKDADASGISFIETGDYFVYSSSGNIWIDYLPW